MTKALLLFTLLCTCGPAQMLAQLTLSVNAGHSFGTINRQPDIVGDIVHTRNDSYLDALNSATAALEISYVPATTSLSWGLLIGYSRRGYKHLLEKEIDGEQQNGFLFPSHTDYLDINPRLTYRPGKLLSASIGPYFSLGRKLEDNPFVIESDRTTNTYDYGFNVEGRLHFGRAYIYTAYQRSLHKYDYSEVPDTRSGGLLLSVERPSPISALRVGIGFTIIR